MDLREIGWGGMDWINRAQDRLVEGFREHGNELLLLLLLLLLVLVRRY
jgi:hypothetical protein